MSVVGTTGDDFRKKLALMMAPQALDSSPIQSPWQGASRMAQALLLGMDMNRADKQDSEFGKKLQNLPGLGPSPAMPTPAAPAAGSPLVTALGPGNSQPANPGQPLGAEDMDKVVRTIVGEAGNQSPEGQRAVANVIFNRSQQSGKNIGDVILAPGQFEPWGNAAARSRMEALDPNSRAYQEAELSALEARDKDATGGATHFYAPKAQAALGRPAPSWDNGTGRDIGDHRFFSLGYNGQGANGIPQPTQVASNNPQFAPGAPSAAPAPSMVPGAQASPAPPQGRPEVSIPPQVAGTIREYLGSKNPQVRALGMQLYQQYAKPPEWDAKEVGGRLVAFDKKSGQARDATPQLPGFRPLTDPSERARYGIPAEDKRPYQVDANNKLINPPAENRINIDQRAPNEFEKEYGQGMGKRAVSVLDTADKAQMNIQRISLMGSMLDAASTGKLAPAQATVGAWAQAVGLDPAKLGIDPKLPMLSQAGQGLINQHMVGMIGSGGFPANNFSDADRSFLLKGLPSFSNVPGANKVLVEVARRVEQRKIDRANAWMDAREQGKSFEKFEREWSAKIRKEDMFADIQEQVKAMGGGWTDVAPGTRIRERP